MMTSSVKTPSVTIGRRYVLLSACATVLTCIAVAVSAAAHREDRPPRVLAVFSANRDPSEFWIRRVKQIAAAPARLEAGIIVEDFTRLSPDRITRVADALGVEGGIRLWNRDVVELLAAYDVERLPVVLWATEGHPVEVLEGDAWSVEEVKRCLTR
jgi:hypothetical protein